MNSTFYNLGIQLLGMGMKLASLFHPKAKLWIQGRKNVFTHIQSKISKNDKVIWMHASSLGEYEQGLPVLNALKDRYPNYKFAVSFFSPSGYEVVKDKSWADVIFYLPLDTSLNAKELIKALHPSCAIFVKYDFWFHLLNELSKNKIQTIFISSIFRENQIYFKPNGKWMVSILKKINHFFVQNDKSLRLLNSIHISQATVAGDTRFDRVKMLLNLKHDLPWLAQFKQNNTLVIAGSTWKKDDELFINFINSNTNKKLKFVIAPHNMNKEYFNDLKYKFNCKVLFYSEISPELNLSDFSVLILDTIGILNSVYSYGDISYVGGGFGKEGVHNVLEPAVYKQPVIFGPIYDKFIEAEELSNSNGGIVIKNQSEFNSIINSLVLDPDYRNSLGGKAQNYVLNKPNSTQIIVDYLDNQL